MNAGRSSIPFLGYAKRNEYMLYRVVRQVSGSRISPGCQLVEAFW